MPKDRGAYVSVYTVLIDSPEYDALSLNAASVWWALKLCPEANMLGIFRVFEDQLSHRSKIPVEWIAPALQELEAADWIRTEGRWVWLRNHLRFCPQYAPGNPNHISGLVAKINGLPKIALVEECVSYYQALGYLPARLEREGLNSDPSPPNTKAKAVAVPKANTEALTAAVADQKLLIDAYNGCFRAAISYTPGNMTAAKRFYDQGYTLEQALVLFEAVVQCRTPSATWARNVNREFEFLIRPSYVNKNNQVVQAMLDKVMNELASGREPDTRPQ